MPTARGYGGNNYVSSSFTLGSCDRADLRGIIIGTSCSGQLTVTATGRGSSECACTTNDLNVVPRCASEASSRLLWVSPG